MTVIGPFSTFAFCRDKGGGTYCFCDGSHLRQHGRKTSCPLCNLNTLWNILMILGRNVERTSRRVADKNDNFGFLTFGVISLCLFEIDFMSTL